MIYEAIIRNVDDVGQLNHIKPPATMVFFPNYIGLELKLTYESGKVISSDIYDTNQLKEINTALREAQAICAGYPLCVVGKIVCADPKYQSANDIKQAIEEQPQMIRALDFRFLAYDIYVSGQDTLSLIGNAYNYHSRLLLLTKIGFTAVEGRLTDITQLSRVMATQVNSFSRHTLPHGRYKSDGIVARLYDLDLSRLYREGHIPTVSPELVHNPL